MFSLKNSCYVLFYICSTFLFDGMCALIVIQYTSQSSWKIGYNIAIKQLENFPCTIKQIHHSCNNLKKRVKIEATGKGSLTDA